MHDQTPREVQIRNAVDMTLAQLRMLVAQLNSLQAGAADRPSHQADLFAVMVAAVNCHEWLSTQMAEANSATPGASAALLGELMKGIAPSESAETSSIEPLIH